VWLNFSHRCFFYSWGIIRRNAEVIACAGGQLPSRIFFGPASGSKAQQKISAASLIGPRGKNEKHPSIRVLIGEEALAKTLFFGKMGNLLLKP
jgi:hypothetical protein